MTTDNTDQTSPIWPSSRWHLLLARPEYIPHTHRYRQISHEEFRVLSRYLDTYREYGRIVVVNALDTVIIPRVTGLPVSQDGWKDKSRFERRDIPFMLGENDFVLVIFGKVSGMYIHVAYSRADEAKFKEWVETGIIEPRRYGDLTGDYPATQFLLLAEKVGKNAARIENARKILSRMQDSESVDENSHEELKKIISGFDQENLQEVKSAGITPWAFDSFVVRIKEGIRQLEEQQRKTNLLTDIEAGLGQPDPHDYFARVKTLRGQLEAVRENLSQHETALANLEILRDYLKRVEKTPAVKTEQERRGRAPIG